MGEQFDELPAEGHQSDYPPRQHTPSILISSMREGMVRGAGAALALGYAAFIGWLYIRQPQNAAEVTGGLSARLGTYEIDRQAFDEGLQFFRRDQFAAARIAFDRADPAQQDARTQFYVAYSYYREGWGRLSQDDRLFAQGLETINRAMARARGGRIVVDDENLQMRSADELKAELEAGLRLNATDFNPLRVLRPRK
jgi:hypothetical protein